MLKEILILTFVCVIMQVNAGFDDIVIAEPDDSSSTSANNGYTTSRPPPPPPPSSHYVQSTTEEIPQVKKCNNGLGECTPSHQCFDGKFNTDGANIIDIRFNEGEECIEYFETCCSDGDIAPPTQRPPIDIKKLPTKCGLRNIHGVEFQIAGHKDGESEYGEWPWMAAIIKRELAGDKYNLVYQCGGSLIGPSVVLTAAHCVYGKNINEFLVRLGEWDTQTILEIYPHTEHEIDSMAVHEQFQKANVFNDVALLFLKNPAVYDKHINTVCLPPQHFNFDHRRCFTAGWGKDKFGREGVYQSILKKVEVPVVPRTKCQENLRKTRLGNRFQLHNSFICAGGEEGKDSCKGDGGSPLVCEIDGSSGHYYQAGIVAWGIGCGDKDVPGVFVGLAEFRDWIDRKVQEKNLPTLTYTY